MRKSFGDSSASRALAFLALVGFFLAAGQSVQGAIFPDKPGREDYFIDEANIIGPEERKAVNQVAGQILKDESIPIFVVTIASLSSKDAPDYTIERYAYELFNAWGIGSPERNYGILLVVSRDDRRARIELGSDWGHSHNQKAKEIMNSLIVPAFRQGSFSRGMVDGAQGLNALVRGLALPKPKQPWWTLPLLISGFALITFVIVNLFKTGRSGWAWALIAALGVLIFFMLRAAAASGGSGRGFGGGSSGGGGASGSW